MQPQNKMNELFSFSSISKVFLLVVALIAVKSKEPVVVFSQGENGYCCIKIPDLILTYNGTLIAFGEARMYDCSDWTWTDLVYKRSIDGGKTWSNLTVLHSNSTKNITNTIGNAAPIQVLLFCFVLCFFYIFVFFCVRVSYWHKDSQTHRILVPFTKNNREVFLTYSDDDGILPWVLLQVQLKKNGNGLV